MQPENIQAPSPKKANAGISFVWSCLCFLFAIISMGVCCLRSNGQADYMWDLQGETNGTVNITTAEVDAREVSYAVFCEDSKCPKAADIIPTCSPKKSTDECEVNKAKLHELCQILIRDPKIGSIAISSPEGIYVRSNTSLTCEAAGGIGVFVIDCLRILCGLCCGAIFLIIGLCRLLCGNDDPAEARSVSAEALVHEAVQYNLLY
jgi:hypothetical protein